MCMSPPRKYNATGDGTPLHQRVPRRRLRERQDAADEWLDRAGGEEMQRHMHVLERRIAGTGDANSPHDDEAGIELDRLRADIAQHDHGRVLRARPETFTESPRH